MQSVCPVPKMPLFQSERDVSEQAHVINLFIFILCAFVLGPLELGFQTVVIRYVGMGIEPGSSGRTTSALNH